uniref:Bromodomain adjacent to zinc finger domain 2B n=1 Tax=Acanthochromis polyacanthus TaxID=80966 RepID=A0A3Q1FY71_9TELE
MESAERLAPPSPAPSSLHMASSSTSSSPAPPQTLPAKYSPAPSPEGQSLQMTGDECSNMSGSSNGLNLVSRPAFGLYTSHSGRSEFGGLGSLGLSALAAHSQFGTFPDWWRPSEAHTRGATTFFPPLLGLHPVFVSTFKSHDPVDLQSRSSGKREPASSVGVNGAANGTSASSPTGNSAVNTTLLPAKGNKEKTQANSGRSQKRSHVLGQLQQKTIQKTKEKKPNKRPPETSSMSGSQSGSLSETSTDGEESSSDPDDMEEEEDEDEDDQSSDSEDSDSEKDSPVKKKVRVNALSSHLLSLPIRSDTNLFLNLHPNGAIQSAVQDAPLALITKPRSQSSTANSTPNSKPLLAATSPPYPMPINLSTGTKEKLGSSASPLKPSASSGLPPKSKKTTKILHAGKNSTKTSSSCPPVDLARGSESDIHSSKDSDDSLADDYDDDDDDDYEDDIEDEDSGSKSESNLESDSDGSEDDIKECVETEADSDAERSPLKRPEASLSSHKSSSNLSANCSLLNLQITKPPSRPSSLLTPTTVAPSKHSTPSPCFTFATMPGRKSVFLERQNTPIAQLWQRETRIRTVAGRLQGEVAYFAPCGKKLRQYPDVMKGLQWFLLAEDEIAPSIIAMDGRRSRRTKSEHQPPGDGTRARQWKSHPLNVGENNFQDISDAKLQRKLEAQEIARQAAQIKMMRKLEKQAMAQAAKEARKQQAIMAAEERRKKREQMKFLKQQEKIKRIQQIRMEKELRAQQILEAKRKKKEAAANAKILEAEKRNKVSDMRFIKMKFVSVLCQERERRRQHMILMKAVEARKKAEEKERLKKEKKNEKRLNKERKLELRRLELEKAKELKKPNEDMCLADHKPLPELSRIPGLVLSGNTFSDCLMVLQFLRSFGKVLGLDVNSNQCKSMLTIGDLQEGLLNTGNSMKKVQDLLVSLLAAAVCDPGIPAGHKSKTILGDHLTNVEINRDNVSEILQIYMEGHSEQTEVAALAVSLRTKAFQAHTPSQKASMLAFLVNELCCSKAVISEIDKNIDYMTNLRKDKWAVEGKLRKLRSIHSKKTGKRDSSVGGEDNHTFIIPTVRSKCKRKEGDSEEEEDDDDDSDDQGDDDEEEEEESGGKKGKKAEICEEEFRILLK